MLTKNKIILTIICFFIYFIFNLNLQADEFNISASEIAIDTENNIVIGKYDNNNVNSELLLRDDIN